ncbi:hypothetical protein CAPTEDRAFT_188450 [Capitella teleta]|uniref:SKP1 component POZ domain-containing protein n=1 Tax=Capitella teleta TaxID=283909 RepID=R7UDR1_CAPTE|nr:hypothetical protein CAPTEDRAFT_188450 [Capitella teleta]|eukprot:ELU04246.1 hypothetical protein CAPTEDRAFT_188450 [Capitella teleta]
MDRRIFLRHILECNRLLTNIHATCEPEELVLILLINKYLLYNVTMSGSEISPPVCCFCGGCEGPASPNVKLISSDGLEFTVKRAHAIASNTIEATLSKAGRFNNEVALKIASWELETLIKNNFLAAIDYI